MLYYAAVFLVIALAQYLSFLANLPLKGRSLSEETTEI